MSRSPSATERHEGLTPEELDRPAATSRIYQLSKKDAHVVVAFVLCIIAIVVIATATLVRVPPTPGAIRTTDADLFIVGIDLSPSAVNLRAERHHEQ
jgi:hypothetical protein